MKKRLYIRTEAIRQYTDNTGKIFAHKIYGENGTEVYFQERMQGEIKKDSNFRYPKHNRILFSINFKGLTRNTSKFTDIHGGKESLYINYALDLLEQSSLEEFYKVALLLTKERTINSIKSFIKAKEERKKTGFWPYPINTSPKTYIQWHTLDKKIVKSIDVTEEDLTYFKSYIECEH